MSEQDVRCVPLCGAAKAYGDRVQWWQHEPSCPAREAQRRAARDDDRLAEGKPQP